jgi:hypothetical protein
MRAGLGTRMRMPELSLDGPERAPEGVGHDRDRRAEHRQLAELAEMTRRHRHASGTLRGRTTWHAMTADDVRSSPKSTERSVIRLPLPLRGGTGAAFMPQSDAGAVRPRALSAPCKAT